jgi:outer membrane cobalamin receptor
MNLRRLFTINVFLATFFGALSMERTRRLLILTLGAIAIWGCRPVSRAGGSAAPVVGREIVITESEIARLSVPTAWDVVRVRAPRLTYGQDAQGRPTRVMIQPRRSVNADETPLLVVDGARLSDIGYLGAIPASDVHAIRILDGEAAEPLYGLSAAGGAIVVETKRGR